MRADDPDGSAAGVADRGISAGLGVLFGGAIKYGASDSDRSIAGVVVLGVHSRRTLDLLKIGLAQVGQRFF